MLGSNKRLEALLERLAHNEVQAIKRHQAVLERMAQQDQERAVLIERTEVTHRALIRILAKIEDRSGGNGLGRKPRPFSPIPPDTGDDGEDS